ncbi:hypothetical protein SELMODRAFT_446309 [Selaginella moellendorffii]|uniref:Uncharacterized protein n=1 Tax=Selaginella moellendorffii TaxID=88036 RepID=D8SQB7_SELML|nr:uncharacterized protein LOC9653143 [Selaginella moellendorffii]EFJ13434.1 hypothetical protein SELMODRAFT_446309 [Selaginella moellendorffii]|eukprot:XP_002985560.1 uncharacterized protein LOC9653143 [Selaginella moellendorffii]
MGMENLGVESERRSRISRKGLKTLSKISNEYDKLSRFSKEKRLVGQYVNTRYDAVAQDPDLAHLLGLLYIHQHWDLFQDFISEEVFQTARHILQDPCSPQLARRFLESEDATQRISDALLSFRFAQRKTMDLSSEKFGERAQAVYEALSYDIVQMVERQSSPSYGKLSHQELELLLCSIKSEPFIEDLLVPCLLPDVLTHREKVEDAVAHARLMLLEAEANIFYGCSFNYAELKAAAKASVTEKQKLHDSSQLLWYMLRNPSPIDKSFRSFYLDAVLHSTTAGEVKVLTPEDYPDTVPPEFQEDLSEKDLRVFRIIPHGTSFGSKSNVVFARMCEFDLKSILLGEPVARERVCQAHILIDKVWPTPKEVYEALVQSVMEGPSSVRQVSKSKRDAHHRRPSAVCRSAADSFRESDGHREDAEPEIFKKKRRKANDSGATKRSKFMMKDQPPVCSAALRT